MLIEFKNVEPEGRAAILEGLNHTTMLPDLKVSLADPEVDALELDLSPLIDVDLKIAAGLFYGFCCSLDLQKFQKTFQLCFLILQACLAEIDWRKSPAATAALN